MNKILILTLSVLIITIFTQGIVDFQYTQFIQSTHNQIHHQVNLDVQPLQLKPENLKFPDVCYLIDQLRDPIQQKQNHVIEADIDEYLQNIKQKFLELLTLTQKLTNSQAKILHFQTLINKTNPVPPNTQKIKKLEDFEKSLKNLTNFIRQTQQLLKSNFAEMKLLQDNTNLIESQRVQINFNIDLLQQKIHYLKDLQQKVRLARSHMQIQNNYNNYFEELEREFNDQTLLIANIDSIIRKKDDLTKLKKQKANLQSSIMALDLYINDVGLCHQEKQNIRKQFKNHEKINQLISELQQLKKNQQPNIYCEGVVKKLTEKIKTMLRYYDIVSSCASDLPEKMFSLRKQKEELTQITQKIAYLESIQNPQDFQKTYSSQKDKIELMYRKIKDWKIKQFTHDPEHINQIRKNAQSQLAALLLHKKQYKPSSIENVSSKSISITIFNLINELKLAKTRYCSLYQQYDELVTSVWTETNQYESQISLKNRLLKLEYEERLKYEQMNKQLLDIRAQIYQKLNK